MEEQDVQNIQRKLSEILEALAIIEREIHRIDRKLRTRGVKDEERSQLRSKYPEMDVDEELLRLVGSQPYHPPEKDSEVIRRTIIDTCKRKRNSTR